MKKTLKILLFVTISLLLIATITSAFTLTSHNITVREEVIKSNKIDNNLDNLIIAYFSDLNFGNNLTNDDINDLSNKINKFNPNIIIFGGDLISDKCEDLTELETFLNSLYASSGKFAVLGEHDIDNDNAKILLDECNFKILDNTNNKIFYNNSYINLVGIEPSIKGTPDSNSAFENLNNQYYTFALCHCPDDVKYLNIDNVDYILSGHSLGGPVYIPLVDYLYRPRGAMKYFKGKHKVNNSLLDISNGVGTLDKDIRMFSNSEIVIYKLKSN